VEAVGGEEGGGEHLVGLHLALVRCTWLYLEVIMGSFRSSFQMRAVQSPTDTRNLGKKGLLAMAYTGPW